MTDQIDDPFRVTLAQLQTLPINPTIAREAHDQGIARLEDLLVVKKNHEDKALSLFGHFVTIALALFGVGGYLLTNPVLNMPYLPFVVAGIVFVAGAVLLSTALLDDWYATVGSHPFIWLRSGTIDGDDSVHGRTLAYITWDLQFAHADCARSNGKKKARIRYGIAAGIVGVLTLPATYAAVYLLAQSGGPDRASAEVVAAEKPAAKVGQMEKSSAVVTSKSPEPEKAK